MRVLIMKKLAIFFLLYPLLFIKPVISHADDANITKWVQNALLNTLAINPYDNDAQLKALHNDFSYYAQQALIEFLGQYAERALDDKITLYPQLNGPATIIESGTVQNSNFFKGLTFWRVHQTISFAGHPRQIDFTVVVVKIHATRYIIQSVDMSLR